MGRDPRILISDIVNSDILMNTDVKPVGIVPQLWGSEVFPINLQGLGVTAPDTFDPNIRPADFSLPRMDVWFFPFTGIVPIDAPSALPGGLVWGIDMDVNYVVSTLAGDNLTIPIQFASVPTNLVINGNEVTIFGSAPGGQCVQQSPMTIFPPDADNVANAGSVTMYMRPLINPAGNYGIPGITFVVAMGTDVLGVRPLVTFNVIRLGYRLVALRQ